MSEAVEKLLVTPVAAIPGRASLRSVGRQELDVPRTRLVSSERAFEVAAPKAWNKLPVDIKSTRDTGLFKKQLKTFLFRAAYPVRAVRRRHCVGGGAPVNFGGRRRRAAGPKKSAAWTAQNIFF